MEITKRKKTILLILLAVLGILLILTLNGTTAYAVAQTKNDFMTKFGEFFDTYKTIISAFIGFGLLTSIGVFIFHFCKLSATASNPQKRAEVINNLLITGVCTALLGGVPLVVVLLFQIVKW